MNLQIYEQIYRVTQGQVRNLYIVSPVNKDPNKGTKGTSNLYFIDTKKQHTIQKQKNVFDVLSAT